MKQLFSFITLLMCLFLRLCGINNSIEHVYYTQDIKDYGIEDYDLKKNMELDWFPQDLPSNAEVLAFSYYNDYRELPIHYDLYLELKFQNEDELKSYLDGLLSDIEAYNLQQYNPTYALDGGSYYSEKNPYDDSFIDIFYFTTATWKCDIHYVGYSVDPDGFREYDTNYSIISYSIDELIVVQTCANGSFSSDRHIPKYMQKFNVSPDELLERHIVVEYASEREPENHN